MKTKLPKESLVSNLEATLLAMLNYAGIPAPRQQFRFHPPRRWKMDMAWPDVKVAAEVHGGTWTAGRHVRGGGFQNDREKANEAQILGWMILEFTADDVRSAGAVNVIARALKARSA